MTSLLTDPRARAPVAAIALAALLFMTSLVYAPAWLAPSGTTALVLGGLSLRASRSERGEREAASPLAGLWLESACVSGTYLLYAALFNVSLFLHSDHWSASNHEDSWDDPAAVRPGLTTEDIKLQTALLVVPLVFVLAYPTARWLGKRCQGWLSASYTGVSLTILLFFAVFFAGVFVRHHGLPDELRMWATLPALGGGALLFRLLDRFDAQWRIISPHKLALGLLLMGSSWPIAWVVFFA